MSDLIQFPFLRQSYPNIDNPLYSQDIVADNQGILSALTALAGLGPSDFAIAGGLDFVDAVSGNNFYTPGFFYLNGTWYYQPVTFDESNYLAPNVTGIMPYTFQDTVTRNIYAVNYSQSTTNPTGATPVFSGDMNQYRIDLRYLADHIKVLETASILENVQRTSFTGTVTLTFENDQAIFYNTSSGNVIITFNMTGAIPGSIVRLKWTFGNAQTVTINTVTGLDIYLESGDPSTAQNNVNIMYFLYAGINEDGNHEVSYNISQP